MGWLIFAGGVIVGGAFGFFIACVRSVYKELHADHETGTADNK